LPSRRGKFSSSLSPFGGLVSDLSQYQVAPVAQPPTPTPTPSGAYPTPSGAYPTPPDDGHRLGIIAPEPTAPPMGWTTTFNDDGTVTVAPPVRPTVAPEPHVLPQPVVPQPAVPMIIYGLGDLGDPSWWW